VKHKQEKNNTYYARDTTKKSLDVMTKLNFLLSLHYPPDESGPGLPPPGGLGTLLLIILILVSLPAQDEMCQESIFFLLQIPSLPRSY
jgi:hypothetical protein